VRRVKSTGKSGTRWLEGSLSSARVMQLQNSGEIARAGGGNQFTGFPAAGGMNFPSARTAVFCQAGLPSAAHAPVCIGVSPGQQDIEKNIAVDLSIFLFGVALQKGHSKKLNALILEIEAKPDTWHAGQMRSTGAPAIRSEDLC